MSLWNNITEWDGDFMEHIVRLHKKDGITEIKAKHGTNLLQFVRKNSVEISSPCGGHGTCGKCRVKVEGIGEKPSDREAKLLGSRHLENGFRLACCCSINSELDLFFEDNDKNAVIITQGKKSEIKLEPSITKHYKVLTQPGLEDQHSDLERVLQSHTGLKQGISLEVLKTLDASMRRDNFKVTLVTMDRKLLAVESGDTTGKLFGVAVDIGTTTIVAYLMDLKNGKETDVYSTLNPQRKFGADVISRIHYANESADTLSEMNETLTACINEMIINLAARNKLNVSDIYTICFVGNTTMMHFLMGLSASNIAVNPFIPVTTLAHKCWAGSLKVNINPSGYAFLFPSVSAYIGADTVAAVLSSGLNRSRKISLLIDIGTNGEMVLGNNKWMLACSTAAGPAFEGANITNGIGGVIGAIDRVNLSKGFEYTTIGNGQVAGICGSGIVDAVAGMLETGIIDETGRIADEDEAETLREDLRHRITSLNGSRAFLLVNKDEFEENIEVAITQKDVREIQNAKAAIAAGIKILVRQAGIKLEDIDRVYLAGGFGTSINIESALKIGLLPKELKGRIESIGNAAGAGAIQGLLSGKMMKRAVEIKNSIKYIELSSSREFTEEYVWCMMF